MQLARDKIRWMALVALSELVDKAKDGPIAPTFTIRLTLAVLYAFSDGDRTLFDQFWKVMQDPYATQPNGHFRSYCRTSHLQATLRGIIEAVGLKDSVAFGIEIRKAWERKGGSD